MSINTRFDYVGWWLETHSNFIKGRDLGGLRHQTCSFLAWQRIAAFALGVDAGHEHELMDHVAHCSSRIDCRDCVFLAFFGKGASKP